MNKDQIKGKGKDIAGRIERQAGEWTGDEETQVEGASKQVEGKTQKAFGDVKERARDLADEIDDKSKKDRDAA